MDLWGSTPSQDTGDVCRDYRGRAMGFGTCPRSSQYMGDMCQSSPRRSMFVMKHPRPSWDTEVEAIKEDPCLLKEILDHLKSQETCAKAIKEDLCFLKEITDDVKTQMCVKAVRTGHGYWMLFQIILNPRRCILKNLSKTQAIWLLSLIGLWWGWGLLKLSW